MKFKVLYNTVSACIHKYAWIHLSIGIVGNIIFATGTILFMKQSDLAGWFFLVGSLGMLLNSLGALLAKTEFEGKTALTPVGYQAKEKLKEVDCPT